MACCGVLSFVLDIISHLAAFGMDYGKVLAHGFLFLKSSFHSKARLSKGVWQQRWMVLDEQTFR